MTNNYHWRQEEIDFLYANYNTMLYKEISVELGRSVASIQRKLHNMNLHKQRKNTTEVKKATSCMVNSICWNCARVGKETCSWDKSRGRVVVEGAKYKQLFGNNYADGQAKIITKCPLFIRGG